MEDILISEEHDEKNQRRYYLHSARSISLVKNMIVFSVPIDFSSTMVVHALNSIGENTRWLVERIASHNCVERIKLYHTRIDVIVKNPKEWGDVEKLIIDSFKYALQTPNLQYFRARK